MRYILMAVLAAGFALPETADAGLFRGSSNRARVTRPASGVGSNLHRRFIIQRTERRARQGLPTTRHYGVYVSGGYPGRVRR